MKILDITGNPFSRQLNNGKTHEAIFAAFGPDEVCQFYIRPVVHDLIDFDYCSSYYCVSDSDVLRRITLRSRKCGREIKRNSDISVNVDTPYDLINKGKLSSAKNKLRLIRDYVWSTKVWKTKEFDSWLAKIKPDAVFIDGGGEAFIYDIGLYVQIRFNIPMVYYVTDDFLFSNQRHNLIECIQYRRLKRKLTNVIGKSSACYAIGEYMAEVYCKYFNKDFRYIMNSVPILPYNPPSNIEKEALQVSYFGSLSLNRNKMIAKLAQMTKGLLEFNVYTFSLNEESTIYKELISAGVKIHPPVKDKQLDEAMYDSDVLLHVESDDPVTRKFTELAVSTKIPEYLMHSRPIIGFGPQEVASMRLLDDNNVGLVVSSDINENDCRKKISSLMNTSFRTEMINRGYDYACANFNIEKNSITFKNHIKEIIDNGK